MQTLRDFRLKLEQGGRTIREPWLQRLCRRGLIPGAELFAGRVWMLPDDAAMPEPRKKGRKPWKHLAEQAESEQV